MSGQILNATLVAAPKQRNTNAEKADLREDRIPSGLEGQTSKAVPQGPSCALDTEVYLGEAAGRRNDPINGYRHPIL